MTATTADERGTGELTHRQIMTILAGLLLGMFLAALDQTIVSTAIRTIADELQGLDAQAWVTTAYLITSTIATPLYGKLGDIYGRKKLFLFAITVFVIGSLLCSFAESMYGLAGYRAIQGVGAGGLMSLALAIIGDIVPPRERAKYQAYFLAVFGTSSVLGPVIGGFFAGHDSILGITGWRWVFLVNVPIGLFALLVVTRTLKLDHQRLDLKVDWWGAAALIVGLVPLLTVAEQGRTWGWGSGRSIACFVVGALGVALFVVAEWRMKDAALIPLRIFKNRAVSVTIIGSVVIGLAMFGGMMMLPLYMQIVHGASPMQSGLMMLPMVGGMMLASIVSGQITARKGIVRPFPIIGATLLTIGLFLLSTISADTRLWVVMLMMFVTGVGLGNSMQPLILIVQNAVSPREIGVATSSATFFRQMGGTIGVAVFLSLLFSTVGGNIQSALSAEASSPQFRQAVGQALQDPQIRSDQAAYDLVQGLADPQGHASGLGQVDKDSSVINRLPDTLAHPFQQGFADSMAQVFLVAGFIAILGLLVLLMMPPIELRQQSAMQARAADSAAAGAATGAAAGAAATTGGGAAAIGTAAQDEHAEHARDAGAAGTGSAGTGSGGEGVGAEPAHADGPRHAAPDEDVRQHGALDDACRTGAAVSAGHLLDEVSENDPRGDGYQPKHAAKE